MLSLNGRGCTGARSEAHPAGWRLATCRENDGHVENTGLRGMRQMTQGIAALAGSPHRMTTVSGDFGRPGHIKSQGMTTFA